MVNTLHEWNLIHLAVAPFVGTGIYLNQIF